MADQNTLDSIIKVVNFFFLEHIEVALPLSFSWIPIYYASRGIDHYINKYLNKTEGYGKIDNKN